MDEYDYKWRNAKYAHVVGKVTIEPETRDHFAEFMENFGRARGFSVVVDRDRPGPPGRLPFIMMTRSDGIQIRSNDFMDGRRASFSLRQPAPRDEWKEMAAELLHELSGQVGTDLVVERGVWVPLGEGEFVATLWGASRKLNTASERLFQATKQSSPGELVCEATCLGHSCRLTYLFHDDQLYRVQLTIDVRDPSDAPSVYESITRAVRTNYGSPIGGFSANANEIGGTAERMDPEQFRTNALSLRWEINFMRVDLSWAPGADGHVGVLEYSDLHLLPQD